VAARAATRWQCDGRSSGAATAGSVAAASAKIQQSTSNGGDGRRDGDAKATAMDGAKAMRRQCDGD